MSTSATRCVACRRGIAERRRYVIGAIDGRLGNRSHRDHRSLVGRNRAPNNGAAAIGDAEPAPFLGHHTPATKPEHDLRARPRTSTPNPRSGLAVTRLSADLTVL